MSSLKETMQELTECLLTSNSDKFKELLEPITDDELKQVLTFRKILSNFEYKFLYTFYYRDSKLYTNEGRDSFVGWSKNVEKCIRGGYASDIDKELCDWLLGIAIETALRNIVSYYSFTEKYGVKFNVEVE